MVVMIINGITVDIPDLEKTGALCAEMVERLGGPACAGRRGRRDDDGQEQDSTPVPLKLSMSVQVKKGETMTIRQILTEAFLLGRDLEAHAEERYVNPNNYDAVCEYVAEEMARLQAELEGGVNV